jgi:hypothetical protein
MYPVLFSFSKRAMLYSFIRGGCGCLICQRLTKQHLALTICGYNAISRFLRTLDVAEMKDVEVGKAKS